MNETQVIERVALVADDQTPEIAQPGEEPLNFPPPSVPAERAAILRLGTLPTPAVGRDHLDAQAGQLGIQWIGIISAIPDQSAREVVDEAGVERRGNEGNLVRRSRGGTSGERKTKTVCHCHELCPFAPLGRSHASAPFLASTKVPSMKHSDRSNLPRSFKSRANASKIRSKVPSRTQRWNRRWQVW